MTAAGTLPMLVGMSSALVDRVAPAAWRPRLRRWTTAWRARQAVGDIGLVVALLLLMLFAGTTPAVVGTDESPAAPLITFGGHWREPWWSWLLQVALVLPLAWRRRAPVPVFLVIAAVGLVQWLAGPELYGDLAILFALYAVVAHEPRQRVVAAVCGVALLGLVLAIARWAAGSEAPLASAIAMATMVALPVALGLVVRGRRRALLATREAAVRAERARISREMHDVVAHHLSVMVALADGARMTVGRDPAEAEAAIAQVARTGRDALTEMRRLLGIVQEPEAGTPLRPQPGLEQLEELATSVRAAGLDVRLDVDPAAASSAGTGLTVHRIVQESLTNVLKHAPTATRADVVVRRAGPGLQVEIRDDGARPSTHGGGDGDGHGLRGMAERVALDGGQLEAGPAAGRGWRVHASLPVDGGPA